MSEQRRGKRSGVGDEPASEVRRMPHVCEGRIVEITAEGEVMVQVWEMPVQRAALPANASVEQLVTAWRHDLPVVFAFVDGDPERPYLLAVLENRLPNYEEAPVPRRLTLAAKESVTIRCGDATIEMDDSGTIVVRGARVQTIGEEKIVLKSVRVEIN
jgi:hypothetical protein